MQEAGGRKDESDRHFDGDGTFGIAGRGIRQTGRDPDKGERKNICICQGGQTSAEPFGGGHGSLFFWCLFGL